MNFLKIFHRKKRDPKTPPQPLRIEGCKTYLTPEPDDAELAAQALLEMMCDGRRKMEDGRPQPSSISHQPSAPHGAAYYRELAERIRKARAQDARRAKRYLTYAEQQISSPLFKGEISEIERGLYPLQDIVEREGGELKRRWQHCLAEVIVRQMSEASEESWESGGTAVIQQKTGQ